MVTVRLLMLLKTHITGARLKNLTVWDMGQIVILAGCLIENKEYVMRSTLCFFEILT